MQESTWPSIKLIFMTAIWLKCMFTQHRALAVCLLKYIDHRFLIHHSFKRAFPCLPEQISAALQLIFNMTKILNMTTFHLQNNSFRNSCLFQHALKDGK